MSDDEILGQCRSCQGEVLQSEVDAGDAIDNYFGLYCTDCTGVCEYCGSRTPTEDIMAVEGLGFCEECLGEATFYCHSCEEHYLTRNNIEYSIRGECETWCEDCLDRNGGMCALCEEYYHMDALECVDYMGAEDQRYFLEDEGLYMEDYVCPSCMGSPNVRERRLADQHIHNYSYTPALIVRRGIEMLSISTYRYRALSRHEHYYGLELEVEGQASILGDTARWIQERWPMLYCKWDGSLDDGFEIVSHPARLDWWQKDGADMMAELTDKLREEGYTSHQNGHCGLHIHTNKESIGNIQLKRLIEFIYSPSNVPYLQNLSRRRHTGAGSYCSLELSSVGARSGVTLTQAAKNIAKVKFGGGRAALNCNPGPTLELRLFRGTLKPSGILGALEFYDSAIHAHDPKEVRGFHGLAWAEYVSYITNQQKRYPQLQLIMEERDLVHDRPSPTPH